MRPDDGREDGRVPAKFLFCGTYTPAGLAALERAGAEAHGAALATLVTGAGGTVEALYWAFGAEDLYIVAELPGTQSAGAVTLAAARAGEVVLRTVVLETADDVDAALRSARALRTDEAGGIRPSASPPGA